MQHSVAAKCLVIEYRHVIEDREPIVFTTNIAPQTEDIGAPCEQHFYALMRMPVSLNGENIDRIYAFDALEYVYDWQYRFRRWEQEHTYFK